MKFTKSIKMLKCINKLLAIISIVLLFVVPFYSYADNNETLELDKLYKDIFKSVTDKTAKNINVSQLNTANNNTSNTSNAKIVIFKDSILAKKAVHTKTITTYEIQKEVEKSLKQIINRHEKTEKIKK